MSVKTIYVVLGMHRSGTSAITRALKVLGVELGDRLMPEAVGNNDKGFWEDVDINRLNIELLAHLNDDWDCMAPLSKAELSRPDLDVFKLRAVELIRSRFELYKVYGFKDPRISRLLPFWQSVFNHLQLEAKYIIACRNPMSVARSLQARDGFDLAKGYQLWLEYSLATLRDTVGTNRIVVDYDNLIDSPEPELKRMAQQLGLKFDARSHEFIQYQEEFLEVGLRHTRFDPADLKLDKAASPAVIELFEELLLLAADKKELGSQSVQALVNKLHDERVRNYPLLQYADGNKALELKISSQRKDIDGLRQAERAGQEKYNSLESEVNRLTTASSVMESLNTKLSLQVASLSSEVKALRSEAVAIENSLAESSAKIISLQSIIADKTSLVGALHAALTETRASTSWRLTGPLRSVGSYKEKGNKLLSALRFQLKRESPGAVAKKVMRVLRREGLAGLKSRIYQQYQAARANIGPLDSLPVDVEPASIVRKQNGEYELGASATGYTYLEPQLPSNLSSTLKGLEKRPYFSIVIPVYNTPPDLLRAVLSSVKNQWYPDWELILADDASQEETRITLAAIEGPKVKVARLDKNAGISGATNAAIEAAQGDYVVFMDHDDELTVDCLYEMALCINRDDPDFIYSDEDKLTEAGEFAQPHFKPKWSPDTLMSTMYTCHVSCVRRNLIEKIGGLRSEFDGCQDWDFVLRVSEHTDRISHIPKVLYHWRILPESVASNLAAKPYVIEASCRVREEAMKRRSQQGKLEPVEQVPGHFRVNYKMNGEPLVSIIIPTRDNGTVLRRCVESIANLSSYRRFEIIILDNGSVEAESVDYLAALQHTGKAQVIRHDAEFNFSELNNIGAKKAQGELLLFLNDDTEVLCADWLERLGGYAQLGHVGAVGAKLLYPGGRLIQHAGVLNLEDGPGHAFVRGDMDQPGYFMRNLLEYNWLAVTGACLMMEAAKFNALGGFDESLPIAYNDIDICMRAVKSGYYNVVCQAVTLIHHESISRGVDHIDPVKHARLRGELRHLYDLNPEFFQYDPFHNVNLHPNGINFEVPV